MALGVLNFPLMPAVLHLDFLSLSRGEAKGKGSAFSSQTSKLEFSSLLHPQFCVSFLHSALYILCWGRSLNQKLNFFWHWHLVAMPVFLMSDYLFVHILEKKDKWMKNIEVFLIKQAKSHRRIKYSICWSKPQPPSPGGGGTAFSAKRLWRVFLLVSITRSF